MAYKIRKNKRKTLDPIKQNINKILYNPNPDQIDKEILTIVIPKKKEHYLKFLSIFSKFNTEGVWKQYKDKNIQYEIEFKDSPDEKYGKQLMKLFDQLNKKEIKEELLYIRTEPVEESTLK